MKRGVWDRIRFIGTLVMLFKYLVPKINLADLWPMLQVAIVGGLIAGAYGIVHDQITYSISPEYFTKLKFDQFRYADFGWGDRVFVATIGFLATWWVGFFAAWFLARRLIPGQPRAIALRQIRYGIVGILLCGFTFGLIGYVLGLWRGPDGDFGNWDWMLRQLKIEDRWAFVRVAYIHNAGYLGGLLGLLLALVFLRPMTRLADSASESARES